MLPRENLVTQLPSGCGALRNAMRRCPQLSDEFIPEPQNLPGVVAVTRGDQLRESEIGS